MASGAASVAFTYNDPVIFAEYAMDTADACHSLGIKTVAVTAGYIHPIPRRAFFFAEEDLAMTGNNAKPQVDVLRKLVAERMAQPA